VVSTSECVVTRTAEQTIVTMVAEQLIVTRTAEQKVVALAAIKQIVARAGVGSVVAGVAAQRLRGPAREEVVIVVAADQEWIVDIHDKQLSHLDCRRKTGGLMDL